jgi:hypothetical protein
MEILLREKEREDRNKKSQEQQNSQVSIKNSAKKSYVVFGSVWWHGHNTKPWISCT